MSHTRTLARIADIELDLARVSQQHAAALSRYAAGAESAREQVQRHEGEIKRLRDDLELEHLALSSLRAAARSPIRQARRDEARQLAAEATKLAKRRAKQAEEIDKAVDALVAAVHAYCNTSDQASAKLKSALALAIPDAGTRLRTASHLLDAADAAIGTWPVAAATALREIFDKLHSPQRIFTLAPGLTLPVDARELFSTAEAWCGTQVQRAAAHVADCCAAEESLAADIEGAIA
jgi:hypothetical protein